MPVPQFLDVLKSGLLKSCTNQAKVIIPPNVFSIDPKAFSECTNLSSISVDENNQNFISVDGILFSKDMTTLIRFPPNSPFSSYTIPSSVTTIFDYAFADCLHLNSLNLPLKLIHINNCAFHGSSIIEFISANASFEVIDGVLFSKGCKKLIHYTSKIENPFYSIPSTVEEISEAAFSQSCLLSIHIPASVKSIGKRAFSCCNHISTISVDPNNPNFTVCDGILFTKTLDTLVYFPPKGYLSLYTIPSTVVSISDCAFMNNSHLKSIAIPNNVTTIGNWAFRNCSELRHITIPASVNTIGELAFCDCYRLLTITVDPNNPHFEAVHNFLICKDSKSLIASNPCMLDDYEFPNCVRSISDYAIIRCPNSPIAIPQGVQSIGKSNFIMCRSIAISSTVQSIGELSLCCHAPISVDPNNPYFTSLDGVLFSKNLDYLIRYSSKERNSEYQIPATVEYIGHQAFSSNIFLQSIIIPSSVKFIHESAFLDCDSLETIHVDPNNPYYTSINGALFSNELSCIICFPQKNKHTSFTLPENTTSILPLSFFGSFNLQTVVLPPTIKSIHSDAFEMCKNLVSIEIPSSVISIGPWAFAECSQLYTVVISSGVQSIDKYAFSDCIGLISITIPATVQFIGKGAFAKCNKLESIIVDANNSYFRSIDGILFSNDLTTLLHFPDNHPFTEYVIPTSVNIIAAHSFSFCSNLQTIFIPSSVTFIGYMSFCFCNARIIFPNSSKLACIGQDAFSKVRLPNKFSIPPKAKWIGESAFNCACLESIVIPSTVETIGDIAFSDCENLAMISVDPNNPFFSSFDGVLFSKDNKQLLFYPPKKPSLHFRIPDTVELIAPSVFRGCKHLQSLFIPSSVKFQCGPFDMFSDEVDSVTSIIIQSGKIDPEIAEYFSLLQTISILSDHSHFDFSILADDIEVTFPSE